MKKLLFLIKKGIFFLKNRGPKLFLYRLREYCTCSEKYKRVFFDDFTLEEEQIAFEKNREFVFNPCISVVVPVYNTREIFLKKMIESVLSQTYTNFELCLFNGGSDDPQVDSIIKGFCEQDSRIKYKSSDVNYGISKNTNEAIKLSTGQYIALLDHDDLLAPNALYECVKLINDKSPDFIYTDEDKISEDGVRHYDTHKKPDWSPDTLLSYNYICHFVVFKRSLIDEVGYIDSKYNGSQDFDYFLRITESITEIHHIPKVLYHWRSSDTSTASSIMFKKYALDASKDAIKDNLKRRWGGEVGVENSAFFGAYRVLYPLTIEHPVTIIAVGSWRSGDDFHDFYKKTKENTNYINKNYVFVNIVSPDSNDKNFEADCEIYNCERENIVKILNLIIKTATTKYIMFLDYSTKIRNKDWCKTLVSEMQMSHVGVVAPKILKTESKIQTYGIAINNKDIINIHYNQNKNYFGYFGRLKITQNVSAISGHAFLVNKDSLIEIGCFDDKFNYEFSIIDMCLSMRKAGYFTKVIPEELFLSRNRVNFDNQDQKTKLICKHRDSLSDNDRYYPIEML